MFHINGFVAIQNSAEHGHALFGEDVRRCWFGRLPVDVITICDDILLLFELEVTNCDLKLFHSSAVS